MRLVDVVRNSFIGEWYASASERDQRAALGIGAMVIGSLFYFIIWQPVRDWRADNEAAYLRSAEQLQYMKSNEPAARRLQSSASPDGQAGQSLLAIVGGVARSQGLTLSRFQPEARGGVSVVMQDEAFEQVLRFVDVLERQHGLDVRQINLDRKAAGRVTARIVVN